MACLKHNLAQYKESIKDQNLAHFRPRILTKEQNMKRILAVMTATLGATSAFAGAVTFIAPEVVAIEEPTRIGGSGAWLIPLIIGAVLLLALTGNNDENSPRGD